MRNLRVHRTGGGPKPPDLTTIEEAISRIFSKTPAFSGIVTKEKADSKIVLKRGPNNNDQIGCACGAQMVAEASNLQKSINSGNYGHRCHTAIGIHSYITGLGYLQAFCLADQIISVENMVVKLKELCDKEKEAKSCIRYLCITYC